MMTKKHREMIRKELVHCDLSPLDRSEINIKACLDDLDERDRLTSKSKPTMKLAVFSDGETVIVVGLDKENNPIDKDGTLFGPESGRDFDQFNETPFDPSKGQVVMVDSRLSKRVI